MRIPQFKDPEVTKFLIEQDRELERTKKDTISAIAGNRALLLYSPDRSVWEITVSNAGAITATKVATA